MKQLTEVGEKQKAHLPNYEKAQIEASAPSATQTFHQSFTLVRSLMYMTRIIKIKPQNSEQATKPMELGQAHKFCISDKSTKATSFTPGSTGVEATRAYTYLAVQNGKAYRR